MKLKYKDKEIEVTTTNNKTILKYRFQKLYYAIILTIAIVTVLLPTNNE